MQGRYFARTPRWGLDLTEYALRVFSASDISARVEWMNSPGVRKGLNIAGDIDRLSTEEWYSRVRADERRLDLVLQADGDPVGMSGLTDIDRVHSHAELYAFVDPACKRMGYGSRLVQETCKLGFEELGLHRIFLWMFSTNGAAKSLYLKTGFSLEGTLRQHACRDGEFVDRHIMGMLRTEWRAGKSASDSSSIDVTS